MKFKIEIQCDNDAFGVNPIPEIERCVRSFLYKIYNLYGGPVTIFDFNGNKVGYAYLTDKG